MAIRLSGTPQQQKAPFSAFDTSSGFQSGLTQVGQALQQAGAGQARVKQRAEVEAARAEVEATRVKDELKRKSDAAQDLAIFGATSGLSVKMDDTFDRLQVAINSGDIDGTRKLQSELDSYDLSNLNLNDHRAQGTVTEITDQSKIQKANIQLDAKLQTYRNKSKLKIAEADVFKAQVEVLESFEQSVLSRVDNFPDGENGKSILEFIGSIAGNAVLEHARSGATDKEGFDNAVTSDVMQYLNYQFTEGVALTEDQLNDRVEAVEQVFDEYSDALSLSPENLVAIRKLYKEKRREVTNADYQEDLAKVNLKTQAEGLNRVMDQTSISNADAMKLAQNILEIPDRHLTTATDRRTKQSAFNLAMMFTKTKESPEAIAYSILQNIAYSPADERKSVADVLKLVGGSNVDSFVLTPSDLTKLNDWVSNNVKALNNVQRSPANIAFLSQYHSELVQKAKAGDKLAMSRLSSEYTKFVKTNPNIKDKSSVLYVEQVEAPTGSIGSVVNTVTGVKTNLETNLPENTVNHANYMIERADLSNMELLNFTALRTGANRMLELGYNEADPQRKAGIMEEVQGNLVTMFEYYKSGTTGDLTVDGYVNEMVMEHNKYEFSDFEKGLPILNQISSLRNLGENEKSELHRTIFRGIVYKNLETLRGKDQDERYEFIREKMREEPLLIPKVYMTESGAMGTLPSQLAGYVDENIGTRGIFRNFLGVPNFFSRVMGDKESLKNVGVAYSAAGFNQIFDNFSETENLREYFANIENLVPDAKTLAGGQAFTSLGAMGTTAEMSDEQLRDRDSRAFVKAMMEATDEDGKPLVRISAPEYARNSDGVLDQRAYLLALTKDGSYVKVPTTDRNKTPMSFSVTQASNTVKKVMPRVMDFFHFNEFRPAGEGARYYLRDFLGMTEGAMIGLTEQIHGEQYRDKFTPLEEWIDFWGLNK